MTRPGGGLMVSKRQKGKKRKKIGIHLMLLCYPDSQRTDWVQGGSRDAGYVLLMSTDTVHTLCSRKNKTTTKTPFDNS